MRHRLPTKGSGRWYRYGRYQAILIGVLTPQATRIARGSTSRNWRWEKEAGAREARPAHRRRGRRAPPQLVGAKMKPPCDGGQARQTGSRAAPPCPHASPPPEVGLNAPLRSGGSTPITSSLVIVAGRSRFRPLRKVQITIEHGKIPEIAATPLMVSGVLDERNFGPCRGARVHGRAAREIPGRRLPRLPLRPSRPPGQPGGRLSRGRRDRGRQVRSGRHGGARVPRGLPGHRAVLRRTVLHMSQTVFDLAEAGDEDARALVAHEVGRIVQVNHEAMAG